MQRGPRARSGIRQAKHRLCQSIGRWSSFFCCPLAASSEWAVGCRMTEPVPVKLFAASPYLEMVCGALGRCWELPFASERFHSMDDAGKATQRRYERSESNPVREIRLRRGESLSEFGVVLAKVMGRDHPYDRSSISKLESGRDAITPKIAEALQVLGAMLDGQGELQARAKPVTVLSIHDLPANTIIVSPAKPCALPGCQVSFVGAPQRRYCSKECRDEAARRRKEANRDASRSQQAPK
jgi:hypothetical protein